MKINDFTAFPGWQYAPAGDEEADANRNAYAAAWDSVKRLYPAHLRIEHDYRTTVTLDPAKVAGLNDLQKAVLAYGGPIPYGAIVTGSTVHLGAID